MKKRNAISKQWILPILRPDIRNIAVTVPYGAGKSSVLLTCERAEDNDFRVMTVSLADFEMQQASSRDTGKEENKSDIGNTDRKSAKAEEKTIEYSILQQLLYKVKKVCCLIPNWAHFRRQRGSDSHDGLKPELIRVAYDKPPQTTYRP